MGVFWLCSVSSDYLLNMVANSAKACHWIDALFLVNNEQMHCCLMDLLLLTKMHTHFTYHKWICSWQECTHACSVVCSNGFHCQIIVIHCFTSLCYCHMLLFVTVLLPVASQLGENFKWGLFDTWQTEGGVKFHLTLIVRWHATSGWEVCAERQTMLWACSREHSSVPQHANIDFAVLLSPKDFRLQWIMWFINLCSTQHTDAGFAVCVKIYFGERPFLQECLGEQSWQSPSQQDSQATHGCSERDVGQCWWLEKASHPATNMLHVGAHDSVLIAPLKPLFFCRMMHWLPSGKCCVAETRRICCSIISNTLVAFWTEMEVSDSLRSGLLLWRTMCWKVVGTWWQDRAALEFKSEAEVGYKTTIRRRTVITR